MALFPNQNQVMNGYKPTPRLRLHKFPGGCGDVDNCELTMELDDGTKLYACKHKLAEVSAYFHRMFNGETEEKCINNIVRIKNLPRTSLWLFLRVIAPYTDDGSMAVQEHHTWIVALITTAARFESEPLKEKICRRIDTISFSHQGAKTKCEMIVAADAAKQQCPKVLEKCVRLCATMKCHEIAELYNQVSLSTLASIYLLRQQFYSRPPLCTATLCKNDNNGLLKPMDQFKSFHQGHYPKWGHSCNKYVNKRLGIAPTVYELRPFKVDMKLLMDDAKWRPIGS